MIKKIKNFEQYGVTQEGKVWSYKNNIFLSPGIDKDGYQYVNLFLNGKSYTKRIHRLVAEVFIPNFQNKKTVDHIDRNRRNNNVSNLRWATSSQQNKNRTLTQELINNQRNAAKLGGKAVAKVIQQRDLYTHQIIATYSSSCEAAKVLFNDTSKNSLINRCANGKRKSAYGYEWRFKSL